MADLRSASSLSTSPVDPKWTAAKALDSLSSLATSASLPTSSIPASAPADQPAATLLSPTQSSALAAHQLTMLANPSGSSPSYSPLPKSRPSSGSNFLASHSTPSSAAILSQIKEAVKQGTSGSGTGTGSVSTTRSVLSSSLSQSLHSSTASPFSTHHGHYSSAASAAKPDHSLSLNSFSALGALLTSVPLVIENALDSLSADQLDQLHSLVVKAREKRNSRAVSEASSHASSSPGTSNPADVLRASAASSLAATSKAAPLTPKLHGIASPGPEGFGQDRFQRSPSASSLRSKRPPGSPVIGGSKPSSPNPSLRTPTRSREALLDGSSSNGGGANAAGVFLDKLPARIPTTDLEHVVDPTPIPNNGTKTATVPATIPIVEYKDGIEWITFVYTHKGLSTTYHIRTDIDNLSNEVLTEEFKLNNCVYPRAYVPKEAYTGNRYEYENQVNAIGWKLTYLNYDALATKRGLIQRAVDSFRNRFPELRSRRVVRQEKLVKGTLRKRSDRSSGVDSAPGSPVPGDSGVRRAAIVVKQELPRKGIARNGRASGGQQLDDSHDEDETDIEPDERSFKRMKSGEFLSFEVIANGAPTQVEIQVDIDDINTDELEFDFKRINAVYPRSVDLPAGQRGPRYDYENALNELGWKLALRNPSKLSGNKVVLQKALDAYRLQFTELKPRAGKRLCQPVSSHQGYASEHSDGAHDYQTPKLEPYSDGHDPLSDREDDHDVHGRGRLGSLDGSGSAALQLLHFSHSRDHSR
ncbi:uncharacterized protein BJ171DRAFT_237937 [Polychytrium aggregatum]|uniref:uncharacterized protein n=1 Tax=Polychytrium aggregatum TaxID=110093 RepID=UPI0022FEC37F|nr:uncharacterized protein BJ171DRAFT_237937 [Polychytrium aggregatum]KAI9208301.1 hypothetical protein BJ171DRAFT_237937 [Polychytrium aggregatum]